MGSFATGLLGAALAACLATACGGERPKVPSPKKIAKKLGLVPPPTPERSTTLSAPTARPNNDVRLLTNGEASFATRFELLDGAKQSIYVQALIFKADTVGRAVADRLISIKKADPDMDIRVIVDAYSNIQDAAAQLMYFEMMNVGIEVEGFEAFYLHWVNELNVADWVAANKRYHEKYWIIDGQRAVVGGMNIADEYARCTDDPILLWRDQDVFLKGPVVADIQNAFLDNFRQFKAIKSSKPRAMNTDTYWKTWRTKVPGGTKIADKALRVGQKVAAKLHPAPPAHACDGLPVPGTLQQGVTVQFLRSRPREDELVIHGAYLEQVKAASKSILIENAYFVPPDDLKDALIAASKRGVAVQVINNSDATNDIPVITKAGRVHYLELLDAGVEVYEWHGEKFGEGTLHAKLAVFDDRVTIVGSYNLDPRSQGLNSEDVVVIDSAEIATELSTYARASDLPKAETVTREQAVAWADPVSLPAPKGKLRRFADPKFDKKAFEYLLLRQIEGSL